MTSSEPARPDTLSRTLHVLIQFLLGLVVIAALLVQAVMSFEPLGNVLAMCAQPIDVPVETFWYAGAVLVIGAGVSVASWLTQTTSGILAGTLLAIGVVSLMLCSFAAFLITAVWEWGFEDSFDPPSAAEGLGQFGVNVAACATPAFALALSAALMLVRRKGSPLPRVVPPVAFLVFTVASLAFQVIRSWVVCRS